jgi:leucyl-tRNA synthetase
MEIARKAPDASLWDRIEKEGWGGKFTNYHLRDWLISRQRYWGPPIPMIFCASCKESGKSYLTKNKPNLRADQSDWDHLGWYPVEEKDLPVALPKVENYQPTGTGVSPLAQIESFVKVGCPGCGGEAVRETDVSDTFLDSAWYFLRYPSLGSKTEAKLPFDPEITKKWLPVDFYFGGAEHSVLHLMYARFITMVLYDLKRVHFEEPFPKLFAHGLMIKEGAKMSKSRGNVVNPDAYIEKFGADALRLYLVFIGPMDASPDFRDTGMQGMKKFVERIWKLFAEHKESGLSPEDEKEVTIKMHQTIKKVTEDIQIYHYNTALSSLMELTNLLYSKLKSAKKGSHAVWNQALLNLTKMLAPFAPHLAEEIWVNVLGQKFSVHLSNWPAYKPEFVKEEEITLVVQVDARLRGQLRLNEAQSRDQKVVEELAKKDSKVASWLGGKKVKKTIFVPGKLINFVLQAD